MLKPASVERFLVLDVLRGITIAFMVIVNNPGNWGEIYAPLKHALWNGFTPTDLVFPTFLFVIGNAISFSLRKYENKPESFFLQRIFKRTLLIFLIGLFLSAFPFVYREGGELFLKDFSNMRIMGVLQRIAICYCLGSIIIYYLELKKSILLSIIILLAYWAILWSFGGHPNPYSLENNAVLKFDKIIFPEANLWKGFGIPFDPEGLLSTLPAVVNVIAGYVAGIFIQESGNTKKTVYLLSAIGVTLILTAQVWDIYFPINKGIWTSTFVLNSLGWDLLLLAGLVLVIEIWGFKRWTYFFEAFGKNPLFIFIISGMIVMLMSIIWIDGQPSKLWIYNNFFLSWLTGKKASLMFALGYMLLMWSIGYLLDKNRIYIKV